MGEHASSDLAPCDSDDDDEHNVNHASSPRETP
jgi:hypothetical protein